ncbi:monofunctional biosynthetic peptidoglycan transglycosylase [Paracoccus sp. MBLB3053]|uniref:Biosynthetic peptidoglycan transglycosylase n=1 Tax=Paracoccus aurantius TaxID=3073814 RepID=A0ABU2HPS8_9RHOB|nr:monofunctional biosynthetic peptidoglycan transglycosylase [Paracoccus sp. MBLB3053]MDS9467052.1 monofunctional biosynthetic peptidoglycan transglycosylase [Paracoccus sp. MBLB3053]
MPRRRASTPVQHIDDGRPARRRIRHKRPVRAAALWLWGWLRWFGLRLLALMFVLVFAFSLINPPTSWTIWQGTHEYPGTPREWTRLANVAPVMIRSVVAAEDANFCNHWGFDMIEIRRVIESGSNRGASTISQQTAKNVFLWQGRSWPRKVLETIYTPMIEALWSKRRIVEVYLNLAEFGPGVFGIHAAAKHHFGTTPDKLNARQAAALAAILPAPKTRKPQTNSARARAIADGAATIRRDGRDSCLLLTR